MADNLTQRADGPGTHSCEPSGQTVHCFEPSHQSWGSYKARLGACKLKPPRTSIVAGKDLLRMHIRDGQAPLSQIQR